MMWIIWSNEHKGWWRPAQCGYTNHRELAGRYSLEEAVEICRNANKHIKWEHMPDEKIPVPNEAMIPADDDRHKNLSMALEKCCICFGPAETKCGHCGMPYCNIHYGTTVMTGNCCSGNEKDHE